MKALIVALIVVAVIVVAVGVWAVGIYNGLVGLDQGVNEKWAQVQNVYQRRADLIPNLVETVKGFAAQERTVLTEVVEARAKATSIQLTPEALNDPKALERFQAAQGQLSGALSRLLVTVERYPELKSNQNFLQFAESARGHREPHRGRAPALQRGGARLQHAPRPVSRHPGGAAGRLQTQGVLRGGARRRHTAEGEVLVCCR